MPAWLVDTNVLVYAYDPRDTGKQARAESVLDRLATTRQGCLSAQVLSEFFVAATRRLEPPLTLDQGERHVANLARVWRVYDVTALAVQEAVRGVRQHQLSHWDGLIWAVARLNGVPNVLTEDLPGSPLIEGVRFVDPFRPTFDAFSLTCAT